MDGFDPARLATMKRVMIITSTWGEGEMPDNADGMWNAINANGPALGNVHFSVCAIGDTAYDEFCKAGHDWNNKLAALGGTEAYPIQERRRLRTALEDLGRASPPHAGLRRRVRYAPG